MFRDDANAAPKLPWPMLSNILAASDMPTDVTTDIWVLQLSLNHIL